MIFDVTIDPDNPNFEVLLHRSDDEGKTWEYVRAIPVSKDAYWKLYGEIKKESTEVWNFLEKQIIPEDFL